MYTAEESATVQYITILLVCNEYYVFLCLGLRRRVGDPQHCMMKQMEIYVVLVVRADTIIPLFHSHETTHNIAKQK